MNQQVYKLALQAGFSSWELNPSKETMSDTPEKIKKLAELIVRECADQCTTDGSFCAEVVWGKQFNKKILKHFGVEE